MAGRSNALSELTRFWLTERHGCLIRESIPVMLHHNRSDIDFLAIEPRGAGFLLPDGTPVGSSVTVETKDEHDFDHEGTDMAGRLDHDRQLMGNQRWIPAEATNVRLAMLRRQHYDTATELLGAEDIDRVFVFHAFDPTHFPGLVQYYSERRVFIVTAKQLLDDLRQWYADYPGQAGLRYTLVGDLFHLLFGYLL